jgi:catechol 2,3-dioxygenase-like lactoylglutathione lyase family enzyme
MAITGVSHITFVVRDVERAAKIWTECLGANEVYDSQSETFSLSREKFFTLGGVWIAVMQGEPSTRSYRHVAFHAEPLELPAIEQRLRAIGAEIRPSRSRVAGEGQSLYFYDFDDNLIEIHSGTLHERLERYKQGHVA